MRKWLAMILVGGLSSVGSSVWASDLSCIKCHGKLTEVTESIKKVGVKSEAELLDYLRNKSPKKALHKQLSDEEIKRAFSEVRATELLKPTKNQTSADSRTGNVTEKRMKKTAPKVSEKSPVSNLTSKNATVEKAPKKEIQSANQTKEQGLQPKATPRKKVEGC